ncbi:MAG TPA: hypothetical protein VFR58_00490 [Flavisolibacter sp.]|nr:hypothetical protein [Flavisolibacter sp.]
MLLPIVIMSLTLVIVLVFLRSAVSPLMERSKMSKRLNREGVEAEAVLLNMQQTGLYVNNLPQIKLQMKVQPRTGRNFVTEANEILSFVDLSQMHIGRTLVVKYNPSNTKEVMLVKP